MEKHYLFLDSICRTILASFVESTDSTLVVKNPVVIQVVNDQQNKMKVQLIPLVFRDIQKDPNEDISWTFNKSQITLTNNIDLNEKLINQYEFVVGLTPEKAARLSEERKTPTTTPVVKLFDEEKK